MCRNITGITRRKRLHSKMKSIFCKQLLHERKAALETAGVLKYKSKSAKQSHEDDEWMDEPETSVMDEYDSDLDILSTDDEVEEFSEGEPINESMAQSSFNLLYDSYKRIMIKRRAARGFPVDGIKFPPPPRITVPTGSVTPIRSNGAITELFNVLVTSDRLFHEHGVNLLVNFLKRRINNKWKNQRNQAAERVNRMLEDYRSQDINEDQALEKLREKLIVRIVKAMLIYKSLSSPEVSDALNDMMAFGNVLDNRRENV